MGMEQQQRGRLRRVLGHHHPSTTSGGGARHDARKARIEELEAELAQLKAAGENQVEEHDLPEPRRRREAEAGRKPQNFPSPPPRLVELRERASALVNKGAAQKLEWERGATEAEVRQLAEDGFMIRPGLIGPEGIARLGAALDTIMAQDQAETKDSWEASMMGGRKTFGGYFPRWIFERDERFLDLLFFQPTLTVARAMLGPRVRVRHSQARVSWPEKEGNETSWHHHMRSIPDPLPPFWSYPNRLDCLIYLDPLDEETGELLLMPGSHNRIHEQVDQRDFADRPGQFRVNCPAGTAVFMHRNMWHRALQPTKTPEPGNKRRIVILQYGAIEHRRSPWGRTTKPEKGKNLVQQLLRDCPHDEELHELLGKGGLEHGFEDYDDYAE